MPTVTTTVTSACASGVTTTQTTTEATPDGGSPSNSASAMVEEMVGSWAQGQLKSTYKKFWSPSVQIDAGPGKVRGWGKYNFGNFEEWITDLEQYNFNGMNWTFYPRPGGAVGEWTVDSLEHKATGRKSAAFTGVNLFDVDASGMITGLRLIFDFSAVEAVFSSDVLLCEEMIGVWGSGKLYDQRTKYFTDDFTHDAGSSSAPGWGQYTMATLDKHLEDLELYEFKDITWDFFPLPGGCGAEWTVSGLGLLSNGKSTGPMSGTNKFTVAGGKITSIRIQNNKIKEVEALFN